MRQLTKARFLLWVALLSLTFTFFSTFLPRNNFMTILNGVFLGIVVAVIIVYAPLGIYSIRKGKGDRVSQLSLAIGMLFFSLAGQRLHWLIWQAYGEQDSWRSNPVLQGLVFISIIGAGLFVTAPGYPPDDENTFEKVAVMGANRNILIFFGAIGGILAFILSIYFERII